jgi:hypothetical protein
MFTLRCTTKALKRLGVDPVDPAPASTTALGDWYVNPFLTRNHRLWLCVSAKSFLCLFLPMREVHGDLAGHLPGALAVHLAKLGIPFDLVEEEVERMKEVTFARTADRQVLGVMNEYAFMTKIHLQRMDQTPNRVSFLLADGVVGPLKERSPAGEARNLLLDARRRATFGVVPPLSV